MMMIMMILIYCVATEVTPKFKYIYIKYNV